MGRLVSIGVMLLLLVQKNPLFSGSINKNDRAVHKNRHFSGRAIVFLRTGIEHYMIINQLSCLQAVLQAVK